MKSLYNRESYLLFKFLTKFFKKWFEMEYPICSIGQLTANECHKITFCQKKGIKNVNCLSEEDKVLLCLRAEIELDSFQTICYHHESLFLKKFELGHKTCSDPLKKHKGPIKKSLRPVTLQQSKCLSEKRI